MAEMSELNEAELVTQAQNGDVTAVGTLYDQHQPDIYRYVRLRVGLDRTAEDLTGEVFTRMLANLPNYRPTGTPFRGWLYRIAHNLIVDHYRKQNGQESVPLFLAKGMSQTMNDPDTIVERKLDSERIKDALAKIDPNQSEVVVLRFIVGLRLKEVAHSLDKSVAAVKSLQHRGLASLRIALKQEAIL
jgi:RNA polymerase sigma-70 factor (ECF subfamily)